MSFSLLKEVSGPADCLRAVRLLFGGGRSFFGISLLCFQLLCLAGWLQNSYNILTNHPKE